MSIDWSDSKVRADVIPLIVFLASMIIVDIILFLSNFIFGFFDQYFPGLSITCYIICIGLTIEIAHLYAKVYYYDYEKNKKPTRLNRNGPGDVYSRAWKYHKAADEVYVGRINFFLVAESMLLFSYVTAFVSTKNVYYIPRAIAFVGILLTISWYYVNIRHAIRTTMLKNDYLMKRDPVYWIYVKSVYHSPTANFCLSVLLPGSIMVLWAYMFHLSFGNNSDFMRLWLPLSVIFLLILREVSKYILYRSNEQNRGYT